MKRFIGFVKKEFFHIFRDPRTMLVLFGIPVVQIILFGYVITNELRDIKIAILDKSNDEVTREIIQKITASDFFILDRSLSSEDDIEKVFREGNVKEVIVFEPGFARDLERFGVANINLLADASDANTANLVVNYTSAILHDFVKQRNINASSGMMIVPEVRMFYNPELKGVYMFVPGIMAMILILISAMMTSISIAREKELGTMEVLLVSPLKPVAIILGKVTPYIALSFLITIIIIVLGYFVFGMPVHGSLIFLLAVNILYIILSLSIGIFISTLSRTQQMAMFMSLFSLMLPTILLSGFIFPIENMPLVLQWLSALMPPRWFIVIIKNVMLKGTGILYNWKEILILVSMIFFFLMFSVRKFKIRLE
jgi:ABC-2 type transport system permease protein